MMIMTDEEGNFSYGPIPPGDYYYRGDVDDDGWYDFNESTFVTMKSPTSRCRSTSPTPLTSPSRWSPG